MTIFELCYNLLNNNLNYVQKKLLPKTFYLDLSIKYMGSGYENSFERSASRCKEGNVSKTHMKLYDIGFAPYHS